MFTYLLTYLLTFVIFSAHTINFINSFSSAEQIHRKDEIIARQIVQQWIRPMVRDHRCPVYLSESIQPVTSNPVSQRLRSASSQDFIVPRTRTKFGDRAFSVVGPTVWNSLPESVRSAETLASFKRKLKTYLFNISFKPAFIIVMPSRSVFVQWLWRHFVGIYCASFKRKLKTYLFNISF